MEFKTKLVREPLKAKSDDWQETAHKWHVMIDGQEFDFYTGLAHRKPTFSRSKSGFTYKELQHKQLTDHGLKELLGCSKATPPEIDDVLHSLVFDAEACNMPFSDWCDNFGCDEDSRKAQQTYFECQKNGEKLRKAGVDIEKERERLQDY